MCDINGEVPLIYLSRIRSFKSGFNYLTNQVPSMWFCKFRLFLFLQKSTLSYMHITERRKIPKCGPFNTLHPHPEMSSTWIEESARKWGRKREREKRNWKNSITLSRKLDKIEVKKFIIRSVTEQQKSCCNSTKTGMRLNFRLWHWTSSGP